MQSPSSPSPSRYWRSFVEETHSSHYLHLRLMTASQPAHLSHIMSSNELCSLLWQNFAPYNRAWILSTAIQPQHTHTHTAIHTQMNSWIKQPHELNFKWKAGRDEERAAQKSNAWYVPFVGWAAALIMWIHSNFSIRSNESDEDTEFSLFMIY